MSARDVIAEYLDHEFGAAAHDEADAILFALAGDGYRILAPGELDSETLEAAASVAENVALAQERGWEENPRPEGCGGAIAASNTGAFIASAIRNLRSAR